MNNEFRLFQLGYLDAKFTVLENATSLEKERLIEPSNPSNDNWYNCGYHEGYKKYKALIASGTSMKKIVELDEVNDIMASYEDMKKQELSSAPRMR